MAIIIEEPKKEGYNPTLKLKKLLDAEYAVVSKSQADPHTGTSVHGEWHLYTVSVHEYVTVDTKTLTKQDVKDAGECSFFPSAKLHEQIKDLPVGVKFKITMEEVEGNQGTFTKYNAEVLDDVAPAVTAQAATPSVDVDTKIKTLKAGGVDKATVIELVSKEYDIAAEMIGVKYDGC